MNWVTNLFRLVLDKYASLSISERGFYIGLIFGAIIFVINLLRNWNEPTFAVLSGIVSVFFFERTAMIIENRKYKKAASDLTSKIEKDNSKLIENIESTTNAISLGISAANSDITAKLDAISSLLKDELSSSYDVRRFNSPEEAQPFIIERISRAEYVTNTFVGTYNDHKIACEAYLSFLHNDRGKNWIDIVGISEVFDARYTSLKNRNLVKKAISEKRFRVKVLRHSPPIVNFIILDMPKALGGRSEVYFGWIGKDRQQLIFRSGQTEIVRLFREVYLKELIDKYKWSEADHDFVIKIGSRSSNLEPTGRIDIVDKQGWWATRLMNGVKIDAYAIFEISFIDNGTHISGMVFDEEFKLLNDIDHSSNVHHHLNRMTLDYSEKNDRDGVITGTCQYKFERTASGINRVLGFVTRDQDDFKRNLYGIKISPPQKKDRASLAASMRAAVKEFSDPNSKGTTAAIES